MISSFGFNSISCSVTIVSIGCFSGCSSTTTSGFDFRRITFFFDGFFGLPPTSSSLAMIVSSGFSSIVGFDSVHSSVSIGFSSIGNSIISSDTVILVSSTMSLVSVSSIFVIDSLRFDFLLIFFVVVVVVSTSTFASSSSGLISSLSGFSSSTSSSLGFSSINSSVTIVSGCFSSSRISGFDFRLMTFFDVTTVIDSSGLSSSTTSGFDFRRIFFDGFFGLPFSSGFSSSSVIFSSGFCSSPGNSMISSVTVILVSSVTSLSSVGCCSDFVFDSRRFGFITDFFVSTSILDSSSSGLVSSSGFCSSIISSFGFKSITSSVVTTCSGCFSSSWISGFDFRRIFFDGSSIISSVTVTFVSSIISLSSSPLSCDFVIDTFRLDFFTVFFTVSTSTVDSTSSSLISSSGFSSKISSFGFKSINSSVTIGFTGCSSVTSSGFDLRRITFFEGFFFGLPSSDFSSGISSSGFSSGISSSGFCSSPGSSIISSDTVTCVSSVISLSSSPSCNLVAESLRIDFLIVFFVVSMPILDSSSSGLNSSSDFSSIISSFGFNSINSSVTIGFSVCSSVISGLDLRRIFFDGFFGLPSSFGFSSLSSSGFCSSSGNSIISSVTVICVSSVISLSSSLSCCFVIESFRFDFLLIFFVVVVSTSTLASSSSGFCSSTSSSFGFNSINSSVTTDFSGCSSVISGLDLRRITFFFEGFFGLPSSGFSSEISSSGFCCSSPGSSITSSDTVTCESSVTSLSCSPSCSSVTESFRFDFFTVFFTVSTSILDSSSSGLNSSSGFSSTISSFGFKSINSSVTIGFSGCSSVISGLDLRRITFFFDGFFGLPSSFGFSSVSSSGFCSSSGSSITSSVTVICVSSVISLSTSPSCNLVAESLRFDFLIVFFVVSTSTLVCSSSCWISSSGFCSSTSSSFGFNSINSSVTIGCFSSSSTTSGFDFRRIFFEGFFFGLPSSGFSSEISSSGFCSSSGSSIISSDTVTCVSSVTSLSSLLSSNSVVTDSLRLDFFTDFLVSNSILDSSSSG
ncbi:hypothetical protein DERF_012717 [Dermatophagoides farinae]|uniref:Uncharacterized protein n=1 Tax=Dermatophagoides farinae TaxID=6954 RepID=A0A922HU09_DERFA|nr:hypothetical protein DERF_012717 [Dermatophagoides farinae]